MKRFLLDTQVLIWWLRNAPELGENTRAIIANPRNRVFVSAVTLWEIQIKRTIGKLQAPASLLGIVKECGFSILVMDGHHAEQVGTLPRHHRDPFDRMLIAQARLEELILVTSDKQVNQYNVLTLDAKR